MLRDGSITVSDLVDGLDTLSPSPSANVARALPRGVLTEWRAALMADCLRVQAGSHWDACGCRMPDLVGLAERKS
jgi:hypothetical protein